MALTQENAPIYEALVEFGKKRIVPFDVPGHKRGRGNPELTQLLGEKCVSFDVNSMKCSQKRDERTGFVRRSSGLC